ncbi:hypothetical protein E2P81_ATG09774 [Venturia nashicola]|uniref:DNA replication checkpoint mediator MRC1 domain-containing protein n=1 Tax=Venturia nashicola TaxID=86259 RepID=A0A4Z1NGF7_9PEZI|nr:hypothetical protein E6O75_ATG09990 [Venturia nashicola]TLD14784.1 hypothetical protein E2P81_ATG09774 [Venturia nashicola]
MSSSDTSRAGSPRSSPTPQSPLMLTPTSRVKALLAAFDDSEDEEQTSLPAANTKQPKITRPRTPNYDVEFENSDGERVEAEETRNGPKSLTSNKETDKSQSDDDEEISGADAYYRLQKQLLSKKALRSSPPPAPASASHADLGTDSDSLPKLQRQSGSKRLARSSPAPADESDSDTLPIPRRQLFPKDLSKSDPAPGGESDSDSLFVSNRPMRSDPTPAGNSDSDSLPDNVANPRFQALVAKKRAERLAKERENKDREAKGKERVKEREAQVAEAYKDVFSSEMNDGMDEEGRLAMAERSRPSARKATKKAQEEMQRQIQRDLRNQQLAHEAKTKKRITTKDLFKVFNFMQNPAPTSKETPPSSPPPLQSDSTDKPEIKLGSFMPKPKKRVPVIPKPRFDDSDDELEIVPKAKSRFAVFDRTPEKNASTGQSFLLLRALARVNSPSKSKPAGRNTLNAGELQNRLQDRMRIQALAEKQERLDELKARGIVILTKEEREHDQLQIENMLERARDDAQALAKKEKNAANKDGKDGEVVKDILSDDDSEDEDWEEEVEDDEVELSGSEEEDGDDEAEADDEDSAQAGISTFVDGEASEDEGEEEAQADADGDTELADALEDDEALPLKVRSSKARARHVIADDEDDEKQGLPAPSANLSQPSRDDQLAAFGFGMPQSSIGLTQMFRGTMDDLQSQDTTAPNTVPNASLDFLRRVPAPTLPELSLGDTQSVLVRNSQSELPQTQATERPIVFQTPVKSHTRPSQFPLGSAVSTTRLSEVPEPTQDAGFEDFGVPEGTIDTVMMAVSESPAPVKKVKKLRRRTGAVAVLSEDEDDNPQAGVASASEDDEFAPRKDAFDILFKAAKKTPVVDTFDKKRSDAKKMVEEQAEESEDEYAGLGGADDDDSDSEMEEELKQMIDEGHVDVDETNLAKFYADRDRAEDEKRIDKLYKDITTGGLRRKRGTDLDDLGDDSDDEAQERRRRKQREFAKMRKALLEDENIGKIAENPKKLAFLRAIEDRDEEDAFDYFGEAETAEPESIPDSQVESAESSGKERESAPDTDTTTASKRKLPAEFESSQSQGKENVAPGNPRRKPADETSKRAKTLAEIREAVSFLIDEPMVPDSQMSSSEDGSNDEHEEDEQASDNDDDERPGITTTRLQHRRPVLTTARPSIINRLSMNYSHAEDNTPSGPLAFYTPTAGATNGGFKVPSLLRRATTNLSTTSNTSTGTATPTGGEGGVRRGGSKKSNIHYQAREAERRKVLDASEKRRRESVKKIVLTMGRQSLLEILGKESRFE